MFHHIPDAQAITRSSNGVFRQTDLYSYKGKIFIKHGSGYAWILKSVGGLCTSMPSVNVEEVVLPFKETYNKQGYLIMPEGK